jgi:CheY-like chemotaxis protein
MAIEPTGLRVLVVEDERSVAEIFRDLLQELGHRPRLAATAELGLSALELERFDAVLLDLYLPRMSGLEFLRSQAMRSGGVPIIGLSGVATETQVRECLQLGAMDFLQKPASLDLMREILDYVRLQGIAGEGVDLRRSPRPQLTIPVRVLEYDQPEWQATSLDLSVFGIRVQGQVPPGPERMVKIRFTPPDSGAPLELLALPVWRQADTQAFRFANLSADKYERLRRLVWQLAA